jgi:transposase-like protein
MPNVLRADEVATLRRLRAHGASIGEIARRTGHSKSTIHHYVSAQDGHSGSIITGRRDLSARIKELEDTVAKLEELAGLASAYCGFCNDGRLCLVFRCSGCGRELLIRWRDEAGKAALVWPEPRESYVNKAGR